MPYKLLICGSRVTVPAMVDTARRAVLRAKEHSWHIVVGDAFGIDCTVVQLCFELGVPFVCYGPDTFPRCQAEIEGQRLSADGRWGTLGEYVHVHITKSQKARKYLVRDEVMARIADRGFAICYKHSAGTIYTHEFMKYTLGKPSDLKLFNEYGAVDLSMIRYRVKRGYETWYKSVHHVSSLLRDGDVVEFDTNAEPREGMIAVKWKTSTPFKQEYEREYLSRHNLLLLDPRDVEQST